jgi:phage FluMu protein Com
MEKYKSMRCPDCQTVLGKIWPLEYGQIRLQLYCNNCKTQQKINVEVKASAIPHNGTKDLRETHRVFVG